MNDKLKKQFVSYDIALELKDIKFNDFYLAYYYTFDGIKWELVDRQQFDSLDEFYDIGSDFTLPTPLYSQVIDWFEKEHNIFIGRTCYDDGKTPKRWVYHVDDYYVQEQSYDGAIRYAIDKIKNKVRCIKTNI